MTCLSSGSGSRSWDRVTNPCSQRNTRFQQVTEPLLLVEERSSSGSVGINKESPAFHPQLDQQPWESHTAAASVSLWECWRVRSDLLAGLRFSHDEAISRTISSYRRREGGKDHEYRVVLGRLAHAFSLTCEQTNNGATMDSSEHHHHPEPDVHSSLCFSQGFLEPVPVACWGGGFCRTTTATSKIQKANGDGRINTNKKPKTGVHLSGGASWHSYGERWSQKTNLEKLLFVPQQRGRYNHSSIPSNWSGHAGRVWCGLVQNTHGSQHQRYSIPAQTGLLRLASAGTA